MEARGQHRTHGRLPGFPRIAYAGLARSFASSFIFPSFAFSDPAFSVECQPEEFPDVRHNALVEARPHLAQTCVGYVQGRGVVETPRAPCGRVGDKVCPHADVIMLVVVVVIIVVIVVIVVIVFFFSMTIQRQTEATAPNVFFDGADSG
jgi:hypothetical protein